MFLRSATERQTVNSRSADESSRSTGLSEIWAGSFVIR